MSNSRTLSDFIGSSGTPAFSSNTTFSANVAVTGAATIANTLAVTGNTTFSNAVSFASNSAINLPVGTTAQRPSGSAGAVRFNSNTSVVEQHNGSRWLVGNYPGSSPQNAANSAVEIWQAGGRGKGFFWLNSPNAGTVLNFCDLDTLDENGQSGWILVAMFPLSQNWRDDGWSTRQTLNPYDMVLNTEDSTANQSRKMWSANWGDYQINRFRIHSAWSVNETGPNATMDWYYHYTTACAWKQVWNFQAGTGNYVNDTSGSTDGNINAAYCSGWPAPTNVAGTVSRCCLRGFKWAYNLKFGYQVEQRWNNLSDPTAGGTAVNTTYNWWAGLTQPRYALGWNINGDGSLAILPQGVSYTTAGQDCDSNNAKVGYDDTGAVVLWSNTATASAGQSGTTDTNRCLYFWIK